MTSNNCVECVEPVNYNQPTCRYNKDYTNPYPTTGLIGALSSYSAEKAAEILHQSTDEEFINEMKTCKEYGEDTDWKHILLCSEDDVKKYFTMDDLQRLSKLFNKPIPRVLTVYPFYGGWASQMYYSPFVDPTSGKTFRCCEQWMMYNKAVRNNNKHIQELIMKETNPKVIKKLGRMIRPFDKDDWDKNCVQVVYDGNMLKFSQHENLKKLLLATGDLIIAEASPYDRIWGTGYNHSDTLSENAVWGQNLLGKTLMRVRDALKIKS